VAREAAGTPIIAVRGRDGRGRVFRNACRHRGTQLADGSGCKRALVCPYHGWTYELDGRLRHVPHENGFPQLDKEQRGLVGIDTVERQGLVFATQEPPLSSAATLEGLPVLIPPDFRLVASGQLDVTANWKIAVESFLEGYHIRATHRQSFYPVQYDNLNVVEHFGRHTRIAFPYQAIEKLRSVRPEAREARGTLTYVYHLFPNVMVATFPTKIILIVLEPLALDRTRFNTWTLTDSDDCPDTSESDELVDAGAAEDREVICAIQRSLASGANEFLEFGLFESAIGHFHRELQAAIEATQ
jgi:phenylpropionate dioxygenase-like ring-hydroxylating dioxygenase large terminal subunit